MHGANWHRGQGRDENPAAISAGCEGMVVFMEKRLYRSVRERKIAGVCGGIGEYFNVDPTLIRLAWVLFACVGGSGLLAYIVCAIVIPSAPDSL